MNKSTQIRRSLLATVAIVATTWSVALFGCSESTDDPEMKDVVGTPGSVGDSILDSRVRKGDSMLVDLLSLADEGVIYENDIPMIGSWVRERGGLDNPDPSVLELTYRSLLQQSLVLDLSSDIDPGPFNCDTCTDSVYIYMPASRVKLYMGRGPENLQEMISHVLDGSPVPDEYNSPRFAHSIDTNKLWGRTMRSMIEEREDDFDVVLFGNAVMILSRRGEDVRDYTYGDIMYAIDRVKEQDEFAIVRHYLNQMDDALALPSNHDTTRQQAQ